MRSVARCAARLPIKNAMVNNRSYFTINAKYASTRMVSASPTLTGPQMSYRNFSQKAAEEGDTSGSLNDNEIIELVEGKVFEVLKSAAKCDHSKLSRTATFEELGFDSLDGVELVLAMEEHFGFDLTNEDAEKITTVMDAIQIFHSNLKQRLTMQETESK